MSNDLEKRVMDLIGENTDAPDVFDDEGIQEIRDSLNDAIEELAIITGCFQKVWHIPLKANCYFYQMPDDFGWFESVYLLSIKRWLEQTSFVGLHHSDARWLRATGTPQLYAPIGARKFAIWPAKSTSVDTLEVSGVAIPERYTTDTDRIKLRKSFEWAAVNRAVSEFWATRGDAGTAAKSFQTYANESGLPAMYPAMAERRWQYRTGAK
jgi:hypothetical protein